MNGRRSLFITIALIFSFLQATSQLATVVPKSQRGSHLLEHRGEHNANQIRTRFWNYGMVGDYASPEDLKFFHSMEVPKGSGLNYADGTTPFVLAKIKDQNGLESYIMETGYREKEARQVYGPGRGINWQQFEPRPGYFELDVAKNGQLSPAMSDDPRTWPSAWADKDNTWNGAWDGYFGKRPAADQESYTVMDDDYYDGWPAYFPDSRDPTRRGLGMRVDVRGFQWQNPESGYVIFWHYDIVNEGTTDYPKPGEAENIIFGLYMDSGVGGANKGCDGVYESDDDNAQSDKVFVPGQKYVGLNLVYTWDFRGHGVGLTSDCIPTGYLGYAYLETPGETGDAIDNDDDGITNETRIKRDANGNDDPGQKIVGQGAIAAYANSHYNMVKFEKYYGPLTDRPAYRAGVWWTNDEDMDWTAEFDDLGEDGLPNTHDKGEGDGIATQGETNYGQTDPDESDQIGLTGFYMSRINTVHPVDVPLLNPVNFFNDPSDPKHIDWPKVFFAKFSGPEEGRFDNAVINDFNVGFLFASGPFTLLAGDHQRFSLALAYGQDLLDLRTTVDVVQAIYNANYEFISPPPTPTVKVETGDGYVQLSWDDVAEHSTNPIVGYNVFEGYKLYRSTDIEFTDPKVIMDGRGTKIFPYGRPVAQFDLVDGKAGYSTKTIDGVAYFLGSETGLQHTWRDTSVTNGMQYYYAVCAYDWGAVLHKGATNFTYYPSESPITINRDLRGGIVKEKNVVLARPNPKVSGYLPAGVSVATRLGGTGIGNVGVKVVQNSFVPQNHLYKVTFNTDPDSIHALSYNLIDSTLGKVVFSSGNIFDGTTRGQVGDGILPIVYSIPTVQLDTPAVGFTAGSKSNAVVNVKYNVPTGTTGLPINYRRYGFPVDFSIRWSNTIIDTALGDPVIFSDPYPVKFTVIAHTANGDKKLPFFFTDLSVDSTMGLGESVRILTGPDSIDPQKRVTWIVELASGNTSVVSPASGDVFNVRLVNPLAGGDVFAFSSTSEFLSPAATKAEFQHGPYVVPNPYVGANKMEPSPFGVSGRGDRRIEFRNVPIGSTIRIFTVHGDLVQTLYQDGSTAGYVPWDLRTKDNMDVAPGLYVFHVDGGDAGTQIGKFAIIK